MSGTNTAELVLSIHSEALSTKDDNPALLLKWSNSTTLNFEGMDTTGRQAFLNHSNSMGLRFEKSFMEKADSESLRSFDSLRSLKMTKREGCAQDEKDALKMTR